MYFGHFPVMLMRRRPRCQIRVKGKASTKSSTGDDQPRDDWPIQLCATDKRSAITGGNACRPDRSREAVKRPGYTGLAPTAPEMTKLMCWLFRGCQVRSVLLLRTQLKPTRPSSASPRIGDARCRLRLKRFWRQM